MDGVQVITDFTHRRLNDEIASVRAGFFNNEEVKRLFANWTVIQKETVTPAGTPKDAERTEHSDSSYRAGHLLSRPIEA